MPIIKSAIKRNKQAEVRRQRNVGVRQAVKADVKTVQAALAAGDAKQTAEAYRAAVSEIDRAVKKGALHANTAGRRKSRLNYLIKTTLGEATKPTKVAKAAKSAAKPASKSKAAAKKPTAKKPTAKKTAK